MWTKRSLVHPGYQNSISSLSQERTVMGMQLKFLRNVWGGKEIDPDF